MKPLSKTHSQKMIKVNKRSFFWLPIGILLLSVTLLTGCSTANSQAQGKVIPISPQEYDTLSKDSEDDVFIIDVHIPEQEHLPGTDAVIPFDEITQRLDELPSKDTPLLLYCRSGSMSAQASKELADLGYTVYDLQGGRNAWLARKS